MDQMQIVVELGEYLPRNYYLRLTLDQQKNHVYGYGTDLTNPLSFEMRARATH